MIGCNKCAMKWTCKLHSMYVC